jgi:lysozyme
MNITPPSRPKASREVVLAAAGNPTVFPCVVAVRAYYSNTFAPEGNNVGLNDDAFFLLSETEMFSFNGNTDPSRYGYNPNAGKYMARLKPGTWTFNLLKHHPSSPSGYMAFGQGDHEVTVERINAAGEVVKLDTGHFGINLHRGGNSGTSSEGCCTVPPTQWDKFYSALSSLVGNHDFPFILIEGPII